MTVRPRLAQSEKSQIGQDAGKPLAKGEGEKLTKGLKRKGA